MMRVKRRPRWITGLKPKLEEKLKRESIGGAESIIIGEGTIRGDMVQIIRVDVVQGRVKKPQVEIEGSTIRFLYPLKKGQSAEDVYYPLIGFLSKF